MGIKSELGEAGFEVWDAWSQQDDSYDRRAAKDVWKSIRATGKVTVATVFHQAKTNGWRDSGTDGMPTPDELAERQRMSAEQTAKEDEEIARERAKTAKKAALIWTLATEAHPDHPYLRRKQVSPVAALREIETDKVAAILGYVPKSGGDPLVGPLLVAPVKVGDRLSTVELIDGAGRKTGLAGRGTKASGYWSAQALPDGNGHGLTLLIGEGVATVLSARQATGHSAVAALSAANVVAVAKSMRERYPAAALVILADLVKTTGAPDKHEVEAARTVNARLAVPDFSADRPPGATDFNDMAQLCGAEGVARVLANAREVPAGIEEAPVPALVSWLEPQPLTAKLEPEPYPIDALPPTIRAAVEEVAGFVKAPLPLVASVGAGVPIAGRPSVCRREASGKACRDQ